MKYWWNNVLKNYLTFTKKERLGLLLLIIVGLFIYFLPSIFKKKKVVLAKSNFQEELAQLKISIDTTAAAYTRKQRNYDNDDHNYTQPSRNFYEKTIKGELFAFDPNTLPVEGFKRLGLREKTIQTIENFRAKGYTFRKPEDLRKIYGLKPDEADRIIPYVRIAEKESTSSSTFSKPDYPVFTKENIPKPSRNTIIDINTADTTAYISLPGIGSKLAFRIVNFRDKLGGFYSVDQVGETYALPDSTFQKIRSRLVCNNPEVKMININSADVNQLKSHPYFRWNIANAIVNYRQQHGNFKNVEGLLKIDLIEEALFKKLKPYVSL